MLPPVGTTVVLLGLHKQELYSQSPFLFKVVSLWAELSQQAS